MGMDIYFPGGKRVYADYGGFTIETDRPTGARRRRRLRAQRAALLETCPAESPCAQPEAPR